MKNVYELAKKMWEIDEEIQKLNDKLKVANIKDRSWIEKDIDTKLSEFLELKHLLERINVSV